MLGSNAYGQSYYAQGSAGAQQQFFKSLSATASAVGSVVSTVVLNVVLAAAVIASATLTKQAGRAFVASVVASGSALSTLFRALKLLRGITKFLGRRGTTRNLTEVTETKPLNPVLTVLRIRIPPSE